MLSSGRKRFGEKTMRMLWARLAALAVAGWGVHAPAVAQEAMPPPRPAADAAAALAAAPAADDGLLSAEELDALLAPVALYPDPLLTQIFVAATYPLDIVKADRWVTANTELPADGRSAAAQAEGWDPSVAVLAAGFPTVVQRMAADLDDTETLGDAVLAQTDDVLDSVQRLRAQASATGYLESNEAQTVTEEQGEIAIAPADPGVVYVPAYDPAMAFTTAPTAPSYVTTQPVYAEPGYSTGSMLATGAIAFGSAMLIDEIFEDDDDDWDDYWGGGSIDWDDDEFYHRPNVDIEGDVNIDRDRINVDRDQIGNIDRDRIGTVDPDRVREGAWQPDAGQRDQARANLEQRRAAGEGRAGGEPRIGAAGAAGIGAAAGAAAGGGAARAKLERSAARRDVAPPRKATIDTPLSPKRQGAPQVHRAQDRGAKSVAAARSPGARPAAKSVHKPNKARPPAKKAAHKSSAFKKSGSGHRAPAASKRGKSSHAKRGGGGGGGGGGRRR
jgi:uncharacterized protein DUF3300